MFKSSLQWRGVMIQMEKKTTQAPVTHNQIHSHIIKKLSSQNEKKTDVISLGKNRNKSKYITTNFMAKNQDDTSDSSEFYE